MSEAEDRGLTYAEAGVDYAQIDPAKVLAGRAAASTGRHLNRWDMAEVSRSRGESAFVWEEADAYRAFVLECLGTKSLVADAMREITGRTYYDGLAQDTVAMVVNDIAAVGAEPQVMTAYWATGSSDWFDDRDRAGDLVRGWTSACEACGVTWGGGETPALGGVVAPGAIDLAGACVGIVRPKENLVLGDALAAGDAVVLVASSGIHANGLTLARRLAEEMPQGYATHLDDGSMFGEALLAPTILYPPLVAAVRRDGVDIHYLSNITGHGWRKLMRARRPLTYRMTEVPEPGPLFSHMVAAAGIDAAEAYGSLNMGAGYAIYVPADEAERVVRIAGQLGLDAWDAGRVESGPRQVIVEPLDVTFTGEALQLRSE